MQISRELLIKFSRDECTEAEAKAVRDWLETGDWPVLAEAEQVPDELKHVVWRKIQAHLHPHATSIRRQSKRSKLLRIAAVGLLAVMAGYLLYVLSFRTDADGEVAYHSTAESRKILLPDSSVVYLAPHSQILLQVGYGKTGRQLRLKGKAAFEVKADVRHPFVVISGQIRTTALGTSFRINSYPKARQINVLLSYGKVRVDQPSERASATLYMQPGDEIVYNKADATLTKVAANKDRFSYTRQVVYFKRANLQEVTEKLERYYQVKVDTSRLNGVHWEVSGEFLHQPLDVVMKTIAYSCNIEYQIKKGKVILLPYK